MGVSINGGTHRWMVYNKGNPTKMDDDWGYPYFRKPPYGETDLYQLSSCFSGFDPDAIASLVASGVSLAPQQLAITAWAAAALRRKQQPFFAVVAEEAMGGFHGDRSSEWLGNFYEIVISPTLPNDPMFDFMIFALFLVILPA